MTLTLVQVAKLDPGGALIGFDVVERSEVPAGAVEVPLGCDLRTDGRYRWNREAGRFDPDLERLFDFGDTKLLDQLALLLLVGLRTPESVEPIVRERAAFFRRHVTEKFITEARRQLCGAAIALGE